MEELTVKYCSVPACRTLVPRGRGRCADHERPAWGTGASERLRVRGRTLQRLRADLFRRHPLCVLCLAKQPQRVSAATIRDHVIPLAEGGSDEETNVQAICAQCHQQKTERESQRGKQRAI